LGNDLNLNATTESTVPTSVHIFRDILLRFRFSRYDTRDGQRADDGRTDVGDQSMHIWPKAGHHCKNQESWLHERFVKFNEVLASTVTSLGHWARAPFTLCKLGLTIIMRITTCTTPQNYACQTPQ